MSTEVQNQEAKSGDNPIDLKTFVDDYQKMLAVIGVLTALAVFWSNMPLKQVSGFASFWCLIATIPLLYEIALRAKQKKFSWSVIIFLNLLTPILFNTCWYVLLAFRPQWQYRMWQLVFWPLALPLWFAYRRYRISPRVQNWLLLKTLLKWRLKHRKKYEDVAKERREEINKVLDEGHATEEQKHAYLKEHDDRVTETLSSDIYSITIDETKDRDLRVPMNLLLNLVTVVLIVVTCTKVSEWIASPVNKWLDAQYVQYKLADQDLAPAPTTSPVPAPTTSPNDAPREVLSSPSPSTSATPLPTPGTQPEATAAPSPTQAAPLRRRKKSSRKQRSSQASRQPSR